ncbi:S41 family peptidase [Bartonella alsatica]|uniref:Carboxy-terminal-processing protease n=3 Tax=Bartonella TaxID=773 RepID=J0YLP8_9HYPH|nr:S41 family peptidase [Bartonella alsatica]EJF75493.1 carboxy-terminal-processing protease [Bartonella alsatica IBS 382]QLC52176.1 S41 family peptidase [Bartonella alsatica]
MIRKVILWVAGVLLGASSMIMVQSFAAKNEGEAYKELALFGDIFERVRMQYVTVPDDKKLIENAIKGMLISLDPHSSYMNAQEAKEMRDSTKGEFGGLGIEVTMEKNLIKVVSPMDDTPASKAGILAGDLISKIDGVQTNGYTLNEAVNKMRGAPGTPITLTIIRSGVDKPIDIKVVRDIIKVKAVKYRVEGDIGYLRIIQFSEQTFGNLQAAIKDIQSKIPQDKLKGYVLDLRLNPGGLLDQAVNVSSAFLNKGEIVSTRGRKKSDVTRFDAKPGDIINGKPLIVLINGGSASASEIVAGALQDHRRATILGTQSFGKGSVQTIIPLGEDGALRLTTALYYTPSGTSIQGTGITPDIIVEQPLPEKYKGYDVKVGESALKGHIKGKQESNKGSGSAAFVPQDPKEDIQLHEAYKLLRGEMANAAFPPDPNKDVLK